MFKIMTLEGFFYCFIKNFQWIPIQLNGFFLIYDISLFNDAWSLKINFALLTRVSIDDDFT